MKYFLKTDDTFMDFRKKLAKALINNSYTSEKTCGCPTNYRKRKLSNILQTAPAHATDCDKKRFTPQKINNNNKSAIGEKLR